MIQTRRLHGNCCAWTPMLSRTYQATNWRKKELPTYNDEKGPLQKPNRRILVCCYIVGQTTKEHWKNGSMKNEENAKITSSIEVQE